MGGDGGRQDAQQVEQGMRQTAGCGHAPLEGGELEAVRQFAVKQQEGYFIEARVVHQLADGIAAVTQTTFDCGHGRLASDDPLQAGGINRLAHVNLPVHQSRDREGAVFAPTAPSGSRL